MNPAPKYHTPTRRELRALANRQSLIIDDLRVALQRAHDTIDTINELRAAQSAEKSN